MPGASKLRFTNYREFWPYYVGEHRQPLCRAIHYVAALASLACVVWAVLALDWRPLVLAPAFAYGLAWIGHFFVERNRPATWGWVRWSLMAEYQMLFLALIGRMHKEVAKLHGEGDAPRSP